MTKAMVVCADPRHRYLCFPETCKACREECDQQYTRLATDQERQLFQVGLDDPNFEGVVNSEYYKEAET